MEKIKILQIGMTNNIGGIETFLINMYRNIDKSKIQIDFLVDDKNDFCFSNELIDSTTVHAFYKCYKHPFKFYKFIKKILTTYSYDIIHINKNSLANPIQLLIFKLAGAKKIILHSHSTTSNLKKVGKIFHFINKFLFLGLADYYFSCSNEAAKWFFNNKIISSNKYYMINNAIDTEKFKFNSIYRDELRSELSIDEDEFVVGHIGRFIEAKNHAFLIDIFIEILKINNNSKLILIGTGPLYNECVEIVRKYNIEDKVYFMGNRMDVYKFYSAFDCFVLPSVFEGLPIVGVEAQAAGLHSFFSNTIDNRVKILDSSYIVDLKLTPEEWAKFIVKNSCGINNSTSLLCNSPYDIKNEINKLLEIYINIIYGG